MISFPIETDSFTYEHLLDNPESKKTLEQFSVEAESGRNLELFVKNWAFNEEVAGSNRTYLVKDKKTREVACYFSLRNGLFTLDVENGDFYAVPAIELSNFAVNSTYRKNHPETKGIGRYVFVNFILPLVRYIRTLTGVQALYIFALPEDKLIEHYSSMGFVRLDKNEEEFVHEHVKPKYDEGCIFMYQSL